MINTSSCIIKYTEGRDRGPQSGAGEISGQTARPAVKPPLKWAGGKRWLLPEIEPVWQRYKDRRLVEPFCGGLAVVTGLMPEKALLNDINPHVINFYQWLKRGMSVSFEMKKEKSRYDDCRDKFNELLQSGKAKTVDAAALFYYLNRTGYNGLCRFNRKGYFNVPFGTHTKITYKTDFSEYQPAFTGWVFTDTDFEKIPVESGDFIYADPPYDVEFTHYSKDGFSWADQQRAAEWLCKHRGPVVLSNQATPRIVKLYHSLKFSLKFLEAPRCISCTGDRTPAAEVLAVRNLT